MAGWAASRLHPPHPFRHSVGFGTRAGTRPAPTTHRTTPAAPDTGTTAGRIRSAPTQDTHHNRHGMHDRNIRFRGHPLCDEAPAHGTACAAAGVGAALEAAGGVRSVDANRGWTPVVDGHSAARRFVGPGAATTTMPRLSCPLCRRPKGALEDTHCNTHRAMSSVAALHEKVRRGISVDGRATKDQGVNVPWDGDADSAWARTDSRYGPLLYLGRASSRNPKSIASL